MNLVERLRDWAQNIRRKPTPLSEAVPMVCQAADRIEQLEQIEANLCELHNVALAEINEQARIIGMGAERELNLMAELTVAQAEVERQNAHAIEMFNEHQYLQHQLAEAQNEIERLSQENMRLKVDGDRLVWAMNNMHMPQHVTGFVRHVLQVGGTGDLCDCRNYIDAARQRESGTDVKEEVKKPELICPRCKVDRFKSPCPDNSYNCPIKGEAQ